ncbi:MAG TPA: polyphosphate kinase 1 [Gammaproteobacteria bacterium]|nr:polyphosphate kinase 1 [Gammaproteobacteria bacterium]
MDSINLSQPELYINRELSSLQFNRRVLEQAREPSVPLLERLKFLCISSTNLDEFFEIRVAGLKQKIASGSVQAGPDSFLPAEVMSQISTEAHRLVDEQYHVLNEELIPALENENIHFRKRGQWNEQQEAWVADFFSHELLPVLSPLGLDPAHPFPRILNKSLNFIVSLEGKDAFGRSSGVAIVQAPRALPRLIRLPEDCSDGPYDFVFLSSIIHAHVDDLFSGMKVTGCYQFRVTRNSDLFVDEEEIDDLLHAVEGELLSRRYGDGVRLEVADNCSEDMEDFLLNIFHLNKDDLYRDNGPVNLNRLLAIYDLVDRPDLKYPPFSPSRPKGLAIDQNIFESIQAGDILLHHPFDSFLPVIDLLKQAASDSRVLAIKQTLYRTGPDSAIVNSLVDAARAGKEVMVVIELRARFDEEANIQLANRLQEAGAHVVYGVVGYKTHAKMLLVTRRESRKLRHYVHLGTGNYHARTARLYTDYGLLSCNPALGRDISRVFQLLTSLGKVKTLSKILQSPFTLHKKIMGKIQREADNARAGKSTRIIVKCNALIEPETIQALYKASQVGVKIDCIIRGVCCLRPGVPGVSDNIQVRSVVGRFLEHTRVFYFLNEGEDELYLSSADWMGRNFFQRVEIAFPVEDKKLRQRILKDGLELYLSDNCESWVLQNDGEYRRRSPAANQRALCAQKNLMDRKPGS